MLVKSIMIQTENLRKGTCIGDKKIVVLDVRLAIGV